MLYYNVRKLRPGHYKSHSFRDPNLQVSGKKMSSQLRGFQILFVSEFSQIIRQRDSPYWFVSKKTYFNSILYQDRAIL